MSGRNYSKKREAILEKLQSTTSHPTAEWIYHELKTDFPKISLATVYRNLKQFRDDGEILSLGQVQGKERFDATTSRHDHFICETCAVIIDIPVDALGRDSSDCRDNRDGGTVCAEASIQLDPSLGFTVARQQTTYFGKCNTCTS